ncbi:hypothetical protein L211DRAFT_850949 [Terfezia boudieri ATCC MYA-4762]|uniref:Uncharacterized protein n=1 Tax=Terfezia boudieri ATCC MYA-4762 TaxID=1051890 RepID=A0A3N4LGV8_9PEZI|nr:hypothetical protein L211DRAFT_850949 [Terfezia boudieri ATCC MYA-4762]
MWSSTPQALQILQDSYLRGPDLTLCWEKNTQPPGQLFWPGLESLTEGSSELFMKIIVLNNALRDITLFQDFALSMLHGTDSCKPECIRVLGLNNFQSAIRVNENTHIPHKEGPWEALAGHGDPSYQELDFGNTTGSQNCILAFASRPQFTPNCSVNSDTGESVSRPTTT